MWGVYVRAGRGGFWLGWGVLRVKRLADGSGGWEKVRVAFWVFVIMGIGGGSSGDPKGVLFGGWAVEGVGVLVRCSGGVRPTCATWGCAVAGGVFISGAGFVLPVGRVRFASCGCGCINGRVCSFTVEGLLLSGRLVLHRPRDACAGVRWVVFPVCWRASWEILLYCPVAFWWFGVWFIRRSLSLFSVVFVGELLIFVPFRAAIL